MARRLVNARRARLNRAAAPWRWSRAAALLRVPKAGAQASDAEAAEDVPLAA